MSANIPSVATTGFANATLYDVHRPSYPPSAVESLLTNLRVSGSKGACILDLGAGTGKFTQSLAERDEEFDVVAVEPHEGMKRELERKELSRVRVLEGTASRMPLETGEVDGVVVAQVGFLISAVYSWTGRIPYSKYLDDNGSFYIRHFIGRLDYCVNLRAFANDEALREIYRVLTPGGVLGMIWNIEDYNAPKSWTPTTEWESKIKSITWSLDDDHPRFRHEQWQQVFEKQVRSTPFSIQSADPLFSLPLGKDSVGFTYWLSPEAVWERYHSLSQVAVLEGEELAKVKANVFEAMSGPQVEKNEKGEVALHGRTVLCWTSSVPGAPLKEGG